MFYNFIKHITGIIKIRLSFLLGFKKPTKFTFLGIFKQEVSNNRGHHNLLRYLLKCRCQGHTPGIQIFNRSWRGPRICIFNSTLRSSEQHCNSRLGPAFFKQEWVPGLWAGLARGWVITRVLALGNSEPHQDYKENRKISKISLKAQ